MSRNEPVSCTLKCPQLFLELLNRQDFFPLALSQPMVQEHCHSTLSAGLNQTVGCTGCFGDVATGQVVSALKMCPVWVP
jgi:hypothetical protein